MEETPRWLEEGRHQRKLIYRYNEGVRISLERLPEDIRTNGGAPRSYEEMLRIVREHPEVYDYDEERGLVLIKMGNNGGNLLSLLSPYSPRELRMIEELHRTDERRKTISDDEGMTERLVRIERKKKNRKLKWPEKNDHRRKTYKIIK